MRFLLDEDVHPQAAVIARGLGLDIQSVHELGRQGLSDEAQLRFATAEKRIMVTRNRDDFIALTKMFFQTNQVHHGILIVPYSLPNRQPKRLAHALGHWCDKYSDESGPGLSFIDFLAS